MGGELKSEGWHESGCLHIRSYKKPSSQKIPLHSSSAHHSSVHVSWPIARLQHFENITSNNLAKLTAQAGFLHELNTKAFGHIALPSLIAHVLGNAPLKCSRRDPCSWLVLPYPPCVEGAGLGSILTDLKRSWPSKYLHMFPRISWRLADPSLLARLAKHLRITLNV